MRRKTTAPTKQRLCVICGDQVPPRAGEAEQQQQLTTEILCDQHMSLAFLRFFVILGLLSDWEDSCWRHHELMVGELF